MIDDGSAACCGPSRDHGGPVHGGRRASTVSTPGMVRIPGGPFHMGSESPDAVFGDGEGPMRTVQVSEYAIAPTTVTNEEFAAFVSETGHVTDAERYEWSFVFHQYVQSGAEIVGSAAGASWWAGVRGASWHAPEGPGSAIEGRLDHPVVHVSWNDAMAYCAWSGTRLPTEAEWEKAARGGIDGARFPWGDELAPAGAHRCNIWQGRFPTANTAEDGYLATAPVRTFEPNGFGLFNMSGNVWEWCADWWSTDWHRTERPETRHDPRGPESGAAKVMRGGSYLCHDSYCNRYRVSGRTSSTPDSSTAHTGFRTAAD